MTELGDGRVLIVGGVQGELGGEITPVLSCEVLDPLKAGSTFVTPLETAIISHTAHALGDGKAAIIGADAARIFDARSMDWVQRIQLHRSRLGHASVLLNDGSILVIGGDGEGSVERVDPRAQASDPSAPGGIDGLEPPPDPASFGLAPDDSAAEREPAAVWPTRFEIALSEPAAVVLPDGRVFVAGGVNRATGQSVDRTWFLDPDDQTITPGPRLRIQTGAASLTLMERQGLILILGGEWVRPVDRGPANVSRLYDPTAGRMYALPEVPVEAARRMWCRGASGAIIALGGYRFTPAGAPGGTDASGGADPSGGGGGGTFEILGEAFQLRINRVQVIPD